MSGGGLRVASNPTCHWQTLPDVISLDVTSTTWIAPTTSPAGVRPTLWSSSAPVRRRRLGSCSPRWLPLLDWWTDPAGDIGVSMAVSAEATDRPIPSFGGHRDKQGDMGHRDKQGDM